MYDDTIVGAAAGGAADGAYSEVVVHGTNFAPLATLACILHAPTGPTMVPAAFECATRIRCLMPDLDAAEQAAASDVHNGMRCG